jgi:hypothetical protein
MKCLIKSISVVLLLIPLSLVADWQQPELSHNLTPLKNQVVASDFELENMDEEREHGRRN